MCQTLARQVKKAMFAIRSTVYDVTFPFSIGIFIRYIIY